jgi:hypothetical protein
MDEQIGVCRDFTHLAVTLCRCLNIPARYCNGYLGDIGVPPDPAPMDFNAWMEAYIGGRWYTFDPRHNARRIGRILIARGRDAADRMPLWRRKQAENRLPCGLSFIRPARRLRTWRRYAAEKIKKSLVVVSQPNRTVGSSGIRTFCFQARLIEATSQAIGCAILKIARSSCRFGSRYAPVTTLRSSRRTWTNILTGSSVRSHRYELTS